MADKIIVKYIEAYFEKDIMQFLNVLSSKKIDKIN